MAVTQTQALRLSRDLLSHYAKQLVLVHTRPIMLNWTTCSIVWLQKIENPGSTTDGIILLAVVLDYSNKTQT